MDSLVVYRWPKYQVSSRGTFKEGPIWSFERERFPQNIIS